MRNSLFLFMPDATLPILLVGAGLLLILGLRRLAGAVFGLVLAMAILPPFLTAFLDTLPLWLLALLGIGFVLSMLRAIAALLIGSNATDHMIGALAADAVKAFFFAPFRLIRHVFRLFRR